MAQRRAVFVTGAGSGIGRAIAHKFAREGWFVGLGDLSREGMEQTVAGMPGGYSYSHVFDVSDRAAWDEALRIVARAAGGRIDCVVNNAGIALDGPLEKYSAEEIERAVAVNFLGAVYGAQAAYPYLKQTAPGSSLVNMTGVAALHGMAYQSLCSATMAAIRNLAESLEAEWAPDGIRVRSVMPGFVDTPLLANSPHAERRESMRERVAASGFEFTPAEAAADACFASINSDRTHHAVGKTARRMTFMARWMPGYLKKRARLFA